MVVRAVVYEFVVVAAEVGVVQVLLLSFVLTGCCPCWLCFVVVVVCCCCCYGETVCGYFWYTQVPVYYYNLTLPMMLRWFL